ncbi:LIM and calponin homology domains-containing protein 1-like isoform X9 [Phyllopteryx taeniolatus]|uniref:LIM and calponin homology domains-containing protein 1-like isoform X9 n=1 Tax=Phyllopteryx taeniolatus TaxID=161469 RepID=UPI002AD53077|nr:LIM and calponin homology domains-containing protein 1-like isoform X9 [Phyllopteryx taeniolatus]
MASPPAGRGRHVRSRPEPACLEAQKWIEAVTGKSFGDKDFRSALENGILLCELLSAIRPGLVKKINRLPAPIAGLDNLSVFLRACEELGLNGSQLFDPGDLQDTSIRANLKDSDCSRKLKNVLNTVFWLGKAASGCASYSGPALDLKEFEGLLANMKADGEEAADGSQKRRVRDSGYDCWDSERSDSLSPPGHTRDNSLDSLDSVGSRSQHSPSPDVANQGTTEGRDGDLVAHGSGRLDAQKDDMSARRAASGEARTPVVFNQFLPSRSNAGSYVLNTRRRPHAEDREQRSLAEGKKTPKSVTWAPDHQGERDICEQTRLQRLEKAGIKVVPAALRYGSPSSSSTSPTPERPASPNIILRRDNDFFNSHKSAWDSSSDGEGEAEGQKVPDVRKDDLASRRAPRGPAVPRMHHFVVATPLLECSSKDQERWEGIRRASHKTLKDKDTSQLDQIPDIITRQREGKDEEEDCEEQSEDAGTVKATPDKRTDDLALRRARSRPSPLLRDGPMSLSSAAMSQADVQKWERLRMSEPSSGVRSARKREGPEGEADVQKDKTADVTNVTPSLLRPDDVVPPSREAGLGKASKKMEKPQRKKASCVADDDLPPVMMNRRVAFMCGDAESASMSDMADRDEAGHSPPLSLSRYERMHEQYNNFQDEDDRWQSDLARWKNRRRCASQELIKKEEERKRMERMNGEGGDKRKSIKTYKEIVEEKERREAELCEAYRDAASPDEAAGVLQRYALRFTISDATLDFLKLPRSSANPDATLNQAIRKHRTVHDDSEPESTQQKTCEDFHVGLKKGPLASDSTPPRSQETLDSPTQTSSSKPEPATKVDAKPQPAPPRSAKPALTLPAPPPPPAHSRPVPLLAAKPYCPPRSSHGIKMDGLVRANGDTDNSPLHSPSDKDNLVAQAETEASSLPEIRDRSPPPQAATSSSSSSSSVSSSSSSAISSLFGGRSCITKTTIVTELTQTLVEPHGLENNSHSRVNGSTSVEKAAEEQQSQPASSSTSITSIQEHCASVTERQEESSMSIETPILNLAKRVNHWVWDPNEERKRVERWQQEQERLLQEQYKKEQEKLKKEWEKAQVEVQEEERKHNEEERKILEETVAPLKPRVGSASPPPGDKETVSHLVPLQQNGHKDTRGSEEQHASKLHFFRDAVSDTEPAPKSESWKTASLGRNTQPNRPRGVKRCDSHDAISGTQRPSSPLPPSPSRCISRKRQCSGCSQPLGKGAAMIIQTLGLFFHMQCFKCGLCEGQLGDATTGTDVRIRNGLLSCHHCYVASTSRGQPTTL